jgi:hypothetical protein
VGAFAVAALGADTSLEERLDQAVLRTLVAGAYDLMLASTRVDLRNV